MAQIRGLSAVIALGLAVCLLALVCSADGPGTRWFNIREYGARGDGISVDTHAIQRTIDACSAGGGGRVRLPEGAYLSGTLRLRDGVTLRGVTIRDSANYAFLFYACSKVRVENATFEGGWDAIHFRGVDFPEGPARWNARDRMQRCPILRGRRKPLRRLAPSRWP